VEAVGNHVTDFGHDKAMEPSDGELWARSRLGDRDAFGALFERHAKPICNYCFRRVGSWATAEDLLSVVFIEAWRRRNKELPPDKVLPWLGSTASQRTSSGTSGAPRDASRPH
jgi:RNA polymerase sigma-70 factor (ECF subfamily)